MLDKDEILDRHLNVDKYTPVESKMEGHEKVTLDCMIDMLLGFTTEFIKHDQFKACSLVLEECERLSKEISKLRN